MKAIGSTFKSSEPDLQDLLAQIDEGKIQLPDFQRGWVWDDDHIRSLIASVSLSYPIGAVMLLQTGGEGGRFQSRPIEGAEHVKDVQPEYLILDGQQRMTSLYLALYSGKPVKTRTSKGQEIERVYYLDIAKCLDPDEDRINAVLSLPVDRKLTSNFGRDVELDVSSPELEMEHGLFPLEILFDYQRYSNWRRGYQKKFRHDDQKLDVFDEFESQVIERFRNYRVPVIELLRDTPREAVCQVFERLNTGGVSLTVFELVTAIYAMENFNLRDDWKQRKEKLQNEKYAVLKDIDETLFLTTVSLFASYQRHKKNPSLAVSCKRRDILKLPLSEYIQYADLVLEGFERVARFLHREKVFDSKLLPYTTQLIPLAAICAELGDRFDEDPVRQKLSQWYWCGVFGELYGGANETRFALDLPEVIAWINGGDLPRTIRDANFSPTRLLDLRTRNSAAYKGIFALLMKSEAEDWLSGDPIEINSYFELAIDIHHIFPKAYCQKKGFSQNIWNSVVNKSPLSAKTNRILGGKAPSSYLISLENNYNLTKKRIDEILQTHQINSELLRNDKFNEFIRDRAARLLNLIEKAMGKTISGRNSQEVIQAFGGPLDLYDPVHG